MTLTLRSYQTSAVSTYADKDRLILADEVGLGKTPPTIVAAAHAAQGEAKLVVVPPYLMNQWADAIRDWQPFDEPVELVERADPQIDPSTGGWYVIGYHTLSNGGVAKHPELLSFPWTFVVFDEAHRLRGRNSQWTKNAFKLKAERMAFLTGTPFVKNPADIWPLLKLCSPKEFRSFWKFVDEWCVTERTPWSTVIGGIKPGMEGKFHGMLDKYMLRRLIEDHLPELPETIPHFVRVELPKAVKKAHDQARKQYFIDHPDLTDRVIATSGGALLIKLRHLTAGTLGVRDGMPPPKENPKRDAVLGLLDDRSEEPTIVFAYYKETAKMLAEAIPAGRPVFLCTGDSSPKQRAGLVEWWKTTTNGVIVATISALQEGANLQHARSVIFAEHSYLPTDIEQAIARVRRSGQQYPVDVTHVLCKGTVDEAVWRVAQKRETSNAKALLEDLRHQEAKVTPLVRLGRIAAALF